MLTDCDEILTLMRNNVNIDQKGMCDMRVAHTVTDIDTEAVI